MATLQVESVGTAFMPSACLQILPQQLEMYPHKQIAWFLGFGRLPDSFQRQQSSLFSSHKLSAFPL